MPSVLAQGNSTCYEPPAINFHLGETPPREQQGGGERTERAALFSFDAGRADDLRPFLGIVDDELAEISGRARKYLRAQIVEPGLVFGIGQPGIDRTVELVDDVRRRAPRRADALPADALVAGPELADGRKVRQQLRPGRA